MGCDIHSYVELRTESGWAKLDDPIFDNGWLGIGDVYNREDNEQPFYDRNYNLFGVLAGVRNYDLPIIAEPRGIPVDVSDVVATEYDKWFGDAHTASWLTVAELTGFDYEQLVSDPYEEDEQVPLRDILGEGYFERLEQLTALGAPDSVRVVFWFDS